MTQNTASRMADNSSASEGATPAEEFIRRLDAIHELPTLSTVAMKLSRLLLDINTSAQDVAKVIQYDQAIVTKMLKLVNSAFFGFSNKVSSVQHALMLLGFNTARNAVISIDVINALKLNGKIKGFDVFAFWRHSIGVAVIGRHLDRETGSRFREERRYGPSGQYRPWVGCLVSYLSGRSFAHRKLADKLRRPSTAQAADKMRR